ncbi:MAG: ATP-binding protein [Nitrospirae bacterium]|nr:ATP-binding protein [Nitrospirota bacterium]
MTQEYSKEEYTIRIKWLIWSRVVLATFLVGTLIFFQRHYAIYPFNTAYVYYFLLSVYCLTVVYWYLLKTTKRFSLLAYLQTSVDILLVTALTHLTGGIDSGFSLLYHLTIISSSIILYRRGGYLSASLSSILYGAMLDMQFYNVPGFVRSQNFTAVQVLFQVFINILSFYIVGLLSGYLSERLRKTRKELREKSIDLEDLRVLQEHILRSVGSGIVTMDLQGNIASWNPAAEEITGYRYDEIKSRWQQVFGDSIKGIFGHTDSLKASPFHFNGQIMKKDGSIALLGMTASLLKDDTNAVRGIILIFQDITKMVEMEDQVRMKERLATVGSLAAGIAHEIRNPLASLSGSIQVLQGELDLKGDNKQLMDIVVRETDRLNTIIMEFLEYARLKNAQNETIELSPVLDETIMLLKNSRDFTGNIRITHQVDPHVVIQGDPQRIRQVFWNLLINACQAMPQGGEIIITARPFSGVHDDMDWCEIIIADTGEGIARDDRDRIFNPFFTTKTGGTGLGLAIVYRIIQDHRGTITVESVPGKGTQFIIRLPIIEEPVYTTLKNNTEQARKRRN